MAGYSKSPRAVQRMLHHLDLVQQGQACAWTVPYGEADGFAYRLRNALYAAKLHSEQFPALAARAGQFKILTVSPSRVEAVLAPEPTEAEVEVLRETPMSYVGGAPTQHPGPISVETIKDAWQVRGPDPTPLFFPGATLGPEDLRLLFEWATDLHILMFVSPQGDLTLRRFSQDLAGLEWTPKDLES